LLRIVADPGVLVSAVLSHLGAPSIVVDRWRDGEFDLVVSPHLLEELESVLRRPKFSAALTETDVRAYVDGSAADALVFPDDDDPPAMSPDPDDDYLVALAIAAKADLIVSGDVHLTGLVAPLVPVLTPRELVDRLA